MSRGTALSAALFVLALAIAGGFLLDSEGLDATEKWGSLAVAVVTLVGVWLTAAAALRGRSGQPTQGQLAEARADVVSMATSNRARLQARGMRTSDPLPVPWSLVRSPEPRDGRTSGLPAAGLVGDLAANLIGELRRPVVVLGDAGAGKSTVADLALLAFAEAVAFDPSARGKVPVRIDLGSWDTREGLVSWAARRIRAACREQGLDGVTVKVARALVQRDMVRLVLDGFDDVPADRARDALQKIGKAGLADYVLLSQPAAFDAAGGIHVHADVVELTSLPVAEAGDALAASPAGTFGWSIVAERVTHDPASPLAQVLRSPFYLALAQRLQQEGVRPPIPLYGVYGAPIRRALIDGAIDAAFDSDAQTGAGRPHPRRAREYLRTMASTLVDGGRPRFGWWDLAGFIPWPLQALAAGVSTYVLVHVPFEVVMGIDDLGADYLAWIVALVVAALGDSRPRRTELLARLSASGDRRLAIAATVAVGVAFLRSGEGTGLWGSDATGLGNVVEALAGGVLFGLVVLLLSTLGRYWVEDAEWRVRWLAAFRENRLPRGVGFRLSAPVLLTALGTGILLSASCLAVRLATPEQPGGTLGEALRAAGVVLLVTSTLVAITASFGTHTPRWPPDKPARGVASNLAYGAIAGLSRSLAAITVVLVFGDQVQAVRSGSGSADAILDPSQELGRALLVAAYLVIVFGGTFAVLGAMVSSAGRFIIAATFLGVIRRWPGPIRTFRFLRQAQVGGLLRQRGHAYVFSHGLLRDALVGMAPPHDTTSPSTPERVLIDTAAPVAG